MSELGSAVMTFGGDDGEFQRAASRVEGSMRRVAAQMTALSSFSFTFPGADVTVRDFDAVAEATGRASKELGGFLARVGRYGAFAVVGTALKGMAAAAKDFAEQMAAGKATVREVAEEVAKRAPFIGNFIAAGRDIRGLLDGSTVEAAKNKADVEDAEKKIELQRKLADAIRKVTREYEDANRRLNFTAGKSAFLDGATKILQSGERAAEDRKKALAETEALFKDVEKRRSELGEKLRQLQEANVPKAVSGGTGGRGIIIPPDPAIKASIAETQNSLAKLGEQAEQYRERIGQLKKLLSSEGGIGGRPTFTALGQLVGQQIAGAFDKSKDAIGTWIERLQLAQKAAVDPFPGFLGYLQNLGVRLELVGRLVDSNIGGTFRKYFGALGQLPEIFTGKMKFPEPAAPFRASFVGLEQLGRQIQQSAASGEDRTQEGILRAVQDSLVEQRKHTDILKKLGTVK